MFFELSLKLFSYWKKVTTHFNYVDRKMSLAEF